MCIAIFWNRDVRERRSRSQFHPPPAPFRPESLCSLPFATSHRMHVEEATRFPMIIVDASSIRSSPSESETESENRAGDFLIHILGRAGRGRQYTATAHLTLDYVVLPSQSLSSSASLYARSRRKSLTYPKLFIRRQIHEISIGIVICSILRL